MTGTEMLNLFRDFTNDSGSSPFVTDARWRTDYLQMWQIWLASRLRWPKKEQTQAFSVGDSTVNLDEDILNILFVMFAEGTTRTDRLLPISEEELSLRDSNWRNASNEATSHYLITNTVTQGSTTTRTLRIYPPTATAMTLRIIAVERPDDLSSLSNSPVFPECLHLSGVYFTSSMAMKGRNNNDARMFWDDFMREFNTNKREAIDLIKDPEGLKFGNIGLVSAGFAADNRLDRFD